MNESKKYFKTSDIRISKDSVGFYEASHKFQGHLYEGVSFASRTDARREAVRLLREKQDGSYCD
jgi:hypothetical protein